VVRRISFQRGDGTPLGHYDVRDGSTLFRAVLRARLPLARSCRGDAVCAACKVRIVDGAEHVAPPTKAEAALTEREPLRAGERYACQARVYGPVTITTTYW
jgi:ferredoxin, 2Fe-2S